MRTTRAVALAAILTYCSLPAGAHAQPVPPQPGVALGQAASATTAEPPVSPEPSAPEVAVSGEPVEPATGQYSSTVRGQRPTGAASARRIEGDDIMTRARTTPYDFLRLVPNLVIGLHEGGGKAPQYLMRGMDADHGSDLAVYVDGIPVNETSHVHGLGYLDLHFLIPELIERIDVRKGAYHAQDGSFNTVGSLRLNLRSKLPQSEVGYSFGAFGTHRALALLTPKFGEVDALVAIESHRTDGFTEAGASNRENVFTKLRAPWGERGTLEVLGLLYAGEWQAPGVLPEREVTSGQKPPTAAFNASDGGTGLRFLTAATWILPDGDDNWRLQLWLQGKRLALYHDFTGFLEDPVHGDQFVQMEQRSTFGGEVVHEIARKVADMPLRATLGAQWRVDTIRPEFWRTTNREKRALVYERDLTQGTFATFGHGELELGRKLSLSAGLRWDTTVSDVDDPSEDLSKQGNRSSGSDHQGLLSPKLGLVWRPADVLSLFLNAGTGFRTPDARSAVQPDFQGVSRSYGAELGARWQPGRKFEAAVIGWWLDTDSDLVFVADAGTFEPGGPARRLGVEVETRVRLLDFLTADADFSYTRSRTRDDDALVLGRAPVLLAAAGLTARHPQGWHAGLRARHVGAFALEDGSAIESTPYTVTDLVGGWESKWLHVALSVQNVLDVTWRDSEYLYESRVDPAREAAGVTGVHFRPGEPRYGTLSAKILF